MRWSGLAVTPWTLGSHGYAREHEIDEHWHDQNVIGLWLGGRALKTLENAHHWFDLEIL